MTALLEHGSRSLSRAVTLGRTGRDLGLAPLRLPKFATSPRGNERVLVFPGFGTGDPVLAPLRAALRSLGHDVSGWGLGTNDGEVEQFMDQATPLVARAAEQWGRPVHLVAWSLGGVIAREVARDIPESVAGVITFGTPLWGPRNTPGARVFGEERIVEIEGLIAERDQNPLTVPITAIVSKVDGVVQYQECFDHMTPHIEHVEVGCTHVAMGFDPSVWSIIARRLVQPVSTDLTGVTP